MAEQKASTDPRPSPPGIEPPAPRLIAPVFACLAFGLLVWTGYLVVSLPSRHVADNWNVAWAGFDLALVIALLLVAYGALRQRTWVQSASGAAAALLLTDAWFDVMTASPGWDRFEAIALAATSEIPLALVCLWIAGNAARVSATATRYALRVSRRRGTPTR